ncbi:GNAT family N-acetyltransferase [Microbacterium sp. SORGH_AS_0421]|uniref:GNAT family N-acetyltransferase n=1 Tax=Microbacterium sp. SORGH_AS_0421 TaxID=3041768 RepID=UPI0027D7F111|nr:GNAT family N-acetyltransferase [Microbacterium sp. SORGH_AS_0421]
MPLRLARIDLDHDSDDLIDFLSTEVFPFHVVEKPTRTQAKARIESGTFASPDNLAYWIVYANEKVGYINFHDMTDNAPMFDLRLAERTRGNGYGEEALRAGDNNRLFRLPSDKSHRGQYALRQYCHAEGFSPMRLREGGALSTRMVGGRRRSEGFSSVRYYSERLEIRQGDARAMGCLNTHGQPSDAITRSYPGRRDGTTRVRR